MRSIKKVKASQVKKITHFSYSTNTETGLTEVNITLDYYLLFLSLLLACSG